ncbi:OmpP1/FadL family transporter [Haloferula sp. A504]|uniref:OmpP1/FadL family transporter n=1 Tax=Haloferula sp. A504 TaxID=3373601 RepID=UPI0031C9037E|nr:outer membrane protein transport protein [Verrucomicrobiaceae bacterium E54]
MKRQALPLAAAAIGLVAPALATNGDNLIGIGPISRSLGGTGIAAPQDAISAVFSNPAAMCISPSCASPQVDAAITFFMPEVNAAVLAGPFGNYFGASDDTVYPIPALGVSFPIGDEAGRWRAGFAAYGVTGLGVDYRGTPIGNPNPGWGAPLVAGSYTDLAIMKIAPSIAYAVSPEFSVGFSAHIDYATLDLGLGPKNDFGFGAQIGLVWKPVQNVSVGLTYISPQSTTFDNVTDFDGNGLIDSLELEAPQQIGIGVAWTGLDDRLMIELDGRWINWSDAAGYDDFDWSDEWVVGLGVQYELLPRKLWIRGGYNFGTNPVKKHNGFNGAFLPGGIPAQVVNVQGKNIPRYYYETFRTIGFPAIVRHHLTIGVGWQIRPDLVLNVAYMHAFEESFSQTGAGPAGVPITLRSDLSEDSVDMGLTWRY